MSVRIASARAYRRVTLAALIFQIAIIFTGAAVRLTGSGLGCPDWPRCVEGRLVAEWEYHAVIEFVNRAMSAPVLVTALAAALGAWWRVPRRRDLLLLASGLVLGTLTQIVLGGLTVLLELRPEVVMAHFLVSMLLVWCAVVLHQRAGRADAPAQPVVERELLWLGRFIVAATGVVVFTGTVVTATGPHGGDERVERLALHLPDVARVHAVSVLLLVAFSVVTVLLLRSSGAPVKLYHRGLVVLGVLGAQALVGYVQYLTGVPEVLVMVHIAGAVAVWISVLWFVLAFAERPRLGVADPATLSLDSGGEGQPRRAMTNRPTTTATTSSTP